MNINYQQIDENNFFGETQAPISQTTHASQNLELIRVTKYDGQLYLSADETSTGIKSKIKLDLKNNTLVKISNEEWNRWKDQGLFSSIDVVNRTFSLLMGMITLSGRTFLLFADKVTKCADICGSSIYKIDSLFFLIIQRDSEMPEELRLDIKNKIEIIDELFEKGFYFSFKLNLSQNYLNKKPRNKFLWNSNLLDDILLYGFTDWNIGVIRGYIGELVISKNYYYCVISRRVFPKALGFN